MQPPRPLRSRADRARAIGFTIVEFMVVFAIIAIIAAIAMPKYQQYTYRAQAAAIAVQAEPIRRAIQEHYNTIDIAKYRLELSNAADGSIAGCQAPRGSACTGPSETIVTVDKLVVGNGTVRVHAGLCQVDCPSYALGYTSDLGSTGGGSGSGSGSDSGSNSGGGKGGGKGSGKGGGKSGYFPLISNAHAQSGTPSLEVTNRVLYEFGELMRSRVHASNNAECLQATGTCTVTLKYP